MHAGASSNLSALSASCQRCSLHTITPLLTANQPSNFMIMISAIICTYKRADYLRMALRSLCDQTLPRAEYEIIVIDNVGEAETERVVNEFRSENVELRYIIESRVGLSHARNKALEEARGKYIAYLDDDARADAHWLEALVHTFEKTKAAAIGGRVWLDWDGEKPVWVHD